MLFRSPLTEYAALDQIAGGRTPFFRAAAESLFGRDRVLNLEGRIRGDNFSHALALYRATGERRWLDHAVKDADAYLARRVAARQTDFSDPDSRGLFFWNAFTPQWAELLELHLETGERRFLDAARQGARDHALFVWLAPRIPDGGIRVHEDGLAPAYRSGPRFPRIKAEPETVPAWRASEIGLTSESAPTSKGARGIFLACHAPWMLRIAALTNDTFLHDIARSAIIGRYTSFPGYHLNTARNTLIEGAILVAIVLFLFLGEFRSALVVIITLPLAMLFAFICMERFGMSANLMSLAGLAIGIGMMVDGAVVMVENAFRQLAHKHPGASRSEVVLHAAQAMAQPISFAILIIIVVFLPLFALTGLEGKLFKPMAYAITFAMAGSLILSLTLVPVLASMLLKPQPEKDTWLLSLARRAYTPMLDWVLGHRRTVVGAAVGLLAISLSIFPFQIGRAHV